MKLSNHKMPRKWPRLNKQPCLVLRAFEFLEKTKQAPIPLGRCHTERTSTSMFAVERENGCSLKS